MKAVCWNGIHDVRVETVPDPQILIFRDKQDNCIKVVLQP